MTYGDVVLEVPNFCLDPHVLMNRTCCSKIKALCVSYQECLLLFLYSKSLPSQLLKKKTDTDAMLPALPFIVQHSV